MANQQPRRVIERLFDRLETLYGAQRMASILPADDDGSAWDAWALALGAFELQTIADALDHCATKREDAWPPNLAEFLSICRQHRPAAAHQPAALPGPREPVPAEAMQALHDAGYTPPAREKEDHLRWARNPKSLTALRMLRQGVERGETRELTDILRRLISDPSRATNPEVRSALAAMRGVSA